MQLVSVLEADRTALLDDCNKFQAACGWLCNDCNLINTMKAFTCVKCEQPIFKLWFDTKQNRPVMVVLVKQGFELLKSQASINCKGSFEINRDFQSNW